MVQCCGREMMQAGEWWHCAVCGKRLVERPHGEDQRIIADMIVEYIQEYQPTWKEFRNIIHELWREGHYEDYEAVLPDEWGITGTESRKRYSAAAEERIRCLEKQIETIKAAWKR